MDLQIGHTILLERQLAEREPYIPIDIYNQITLNDIWQDTPMKLPAILPSFRRCLLYSNNIVHIPKGRLGLIHLRSTAARIGLVSPPTVADPGFEGQLTFEVFNSSCRAIHIFPYTPLWSIHLVPLRGKWSDYSKTGRYQGQMGITIPKALS